MSNCIPCPPCQSEDPLICEPYGTVETGNRIVVEDDAFCTKTLASPSGAATLVYDGGVRWALGTVWQSVTQTHFAKNGEKLSVNSSSGSVIVYLPQNPGQFEEIFFADQSGSWGTNNVTLLRNGSLIEGVLEDLVLNTSWPNQIILRFEGSTWRVYAII